MVKLSQIDISPCRQLVSRKQLLAMVPALILPDVTS